MEGFTIIDGVVALFIVMSALLAYSRGLVREALAIAGWVVAGILAFIFAPQAHPLVKEIPVIRDIIGDNCELGMITAFIRIEGQPFGLIANNPRHLGGAIDSEGGEKGVHVPLFAS